MAAVTRYNFQFPTIPQRGGGKLREKISMSAASPRPGTATPRLAVRASRGGIAGKKFIVAVDGSIQSICCLHLTAAILKPSFHDSVQLITVSVGITQKADPEATLSLTSGQKLTPDELLQACKAELVSRGVPTKSITTQMVDPDEQTIAEALVAETGILRRGVGLLVLGNTGKGLEKRGKPPSTGHGSVAGHVLQHCRCPVILVKGADAESSPLPSLRPPMSIVVCIDGNLSKQVFDTAVHFARDGDTLQLVHVTTTSADELERQSKYWEMETEKLRANHDGLTLTTTVLPLRRNASVADTLVAYCTENQPALVILAAVELMKTSGDQPLGSVSLAMAAECTVPICITRNFSAL